MKVPTHPIPLLINIYRDVLPTVHRYYNQWKERAEEIPDPELRKQALDALEKKEFHCEGGGVFGLLARERFDELIQFIIAYQIMCDYLDNLCDQSDYQDPKDFRSLHNALQAALTPGEPLTNYYQYRLEQDDGGYLHELIETCQQILISFPSFRVVQNNMLLLSELYSDLQVHKHVKSEERLSRLKEWFVQYKEEIPTMTWFEFSACTGSTLGIYSLATYSTMEQLTLEQANQIKNGYYPWVQGVHLLLDYFIDQEEDRVDDELNFLTYYKSEEEMKERFRFFVQKAEESLLTLPDPKFHRNIWRGMIAIYMSDEKVQRNKELKKKSKQLIKLGGLPTILFYLNGWIYRRDK
ncbi:tetraprenyl-beta-curcumene synthase family protein [Alkalihalobacillus trypoxylicola]|uniref:Tetraprenyl-beta-curcumene synthase n=1 Tax=Alkalihalobacillus trypoxylicola TaxID=519424 RepID=A0A162CU04_9BACI|nr:tetraprenyl-beta-curcumene synthase family protein [Alkalihalobacillus trypoxylicola]KYG26644.1 tetraprenyl-beta-curcumene synthase [Alkalihalobacillus trypoxylicola]